MFKKDERIARCWRVKNARVELQPNPINHRATLSWCDDNHVQRGSYFANAYARNVLHTHILRLHSNVFRCIVL